MFPCVWEHVYIPLLPTKLIEYLQVRAVEIALFKLPLKKATSTFGLFINLFFIFNYIGSRAVFHGRSHELLDDEIWIGSVCVVCRCPLG